MFFISFSFLILFYLLFIFFYFFNAWFLSFYVTEQGMTNCLYMDKERTCKIFDTNYVFIMQGRQSKFEQLIETSNMEFHLCHKFYFITKYKEEQCYFKRIYVWNCMLSRSHKPMNYRNTNTAKARLRFKILSFSNNT